MRKLTWFTKIIGVNYGLRLKSKCIYDLRGMVAYEFTKIINSHLRFTKIINRRLRFTKIPL